nr:MAG TPA: hypothetical protein [Caudoviricetes sp.]
MRLFAIYHPVLREIPRKTGLFLCFNGIFRLFSFSGIFRTLHVFQQLHKRYAVLPYFFLLPMVRRVCLINSAAGS